MKETSVKKVLEAADKARKKTEKETEEVSKRNELDRTCKRLNSKE